MMASAFRRPFASWLIWMRREWRDLVPITIGTIIVSVSYMAFLLPNRFPASGLNGLAVLSTYVWEWSPAWIVGVGNALLLTLAWKARVRRGAHDGASQGLPGHALSPS